MTYEFVFFNPAHLNLLPLISNTPIMISQLSGLSSSLLHKLFDSIVDIICAVDAEGRFVYINKACQKIWGYNPEELIGMFCFDLMIENDRTPTQSAIRETSHGAEIRTFENHYYHKNGTVVSMLWEGAWDLGDKLIYTIGRDISERQQVEKFEREYKAQLQSTKDQLEKLLERITDGFIGLDKHARVTYWNRAVASIARIPSEEIMGKVLWEVIEEPARSKTRNQYELFRAANKPMHVEVYNARIERWLEINSYLSGTGLSLFIRDITDQKNLQAELLKEKELQQRRITAAVIQATELERAEVGKELHDNVNQILTTVKLYTDLCLSYTIAPAATDLLKKSLKYLQEAIDEIRGLSKRLASPILDKIPLTESIDALVHSINVADRVHIEFTHNVKEMGIPEKLHVPIYRILQEHLTNVLKHAEAKTVRITLNMDEDSIALKVCDDGKGFDINQKRSGVGITNMIIRAENVNGELILDSAPGAGTNLTASFFVSQQVTM
jgi:PAS domain S-box-containing protein